MFGKKKDYDIDSAETKKDTKKKYRITVNAALSLVIAILIVVNVLFGLIGMKFNMKIDLTSDKILDFSELTVETLKNLDEDVMVYGLLPEDSGDMTVNSVNKIMEKYIKMSDKIKYKEIDAVTNPQFLQKYQQNGQPLGEYSFVFETDRRYKIVSLNSAITMTENNSIYISAEEKFTNAIIAVTSDDVPKIAVVEGHGEPLSASYMSEIMESENYDIVPVNLMNAQIDEGTDILIISAPQSDYTIEEIEKVDRFSNNGGNIQVLISSEIEGYPNFNSYLLEWGIEFVPGVVAENDESGYYQTPYAIIPTINESDMTKAIVSNQLKMLIPNAKALRYNNIDGYTYNDILTTSSKAVSKTDISGETAYADGDEKGPFVLATYVTRPNNLGTESKALFGGVMYYLIYDYITDSSFANKDFLRHSMASFSGGESQMYIGVKDISPTYLTISASSYRIFFIVTVFALPAIIFILGLVIWLRRKYL